MNEEVKQVSTTQGESEAVKTEDVGTPSILERTEKAAEAANAAVDKYSAILKKIELAESNKILGGVTDGGTPTEKPKEETPAEYSKRIMSGN